MEQLSQISGYLLYGLLPILGALVLTYVVFGLYIWRTKKHLPQTEGGTRPERKKRPKTFGQQKRRRK